jgi:ubiquinone/menaquinone biosynthesis C-methylase UbiE
MTKRTFDDFDAFADEYRNIHTENIKISGVDSFYFAEMKVKYLHQFENNEQQLLLDIGCGDGVTASYMQQYFPKWNIVGIDVSEESIKVAQLKNLSNAVFSVYDGKDLPFEDGSVDIIFIAGVLHHVSFHLHLSLIKEMVRVLKQEGRLYLFEHNPNNPLTRQLVNTCVFDKDAHLLKNNYAERILVKAGLTITCKKFIIFFPRKGIFSNFIFLEKYLEWLPLGGQYFISAKKIFKKG